MPTGFGTLPDDDPRRLLSSGRTRSPFAGGGGTGGPPAFSGGSEALSRGTGGGFTEALAPFNPPAGLPPPPEAMYNWGTSGYQMPNPPGTALWDMARRYLGSFPSLGETPEGFAEALGFQPQGGEGGFAGLGASSSLDPRGPNAARLAELAAAAGQAPQGVSFNENLGEQDIPLTAGLLRSLGVPANKVSASAPRDVVQAGGGSIADYIGATQPQVTQVHQPEWWESGIPGALISLVPVIGGIQQIAKSLPKGNIGGGLAGIASILASSVGGIGGMPGAGGPAVGGALGSMGLPTLGLGAGAGGAGGGFESLANAVGEVPGGFAGLTGGGFTAAATPFSGLPAGQGFGVLTQAGGGLADPGSALASLGNSAAGPLGGLPRGGGFGVLQEGGGGLAPSGSAVDVGAGFQKLPGFPATPQPTGWEKFFEGTPEFLGREAIGIGKNVLANAGGPSGLDVGIPSGGGGFIGEAAGMGAGPGGAQSGGQTGASRAAGAGGPLDMPGTMQESPEALEQRGRAQAMQRFARGAPMGGYGRMF